MIKTIDELNAVKSQYEASVAFRHPGVTEGDSYKRHVLVCACLLYTSPSPRDRG